MGLLISLALKHLKVVNIWFYAMTNQKIFTQGCILLKQVSTQDLTRDESYLRRTITSLRGRAHHERINHYIVNIKQVHDVAEQKIPNAWGCHQHLGTPQATS